MCEEPDRAWLWKRKEHLKPSGKEAGGSDAVVASYYPKMAIIQMLAFYVIAEGFCFQWTVGYLAMVSLMDLLASILGRCCNI
jgi:hypothetical protein